MRKACHVELLTILALPLLLVTVIVKAETCPPGAEWSNCSGCGSYCPVKGMACATVCRDGCRCVQKGYVLHKGACIPQSACPTTIKPKTCPPGAAWSGCTGCKSYCPVEGRACITGCLEGCACVTKGYVLHNGACIPLSACPTTSIKG
ncbi:SCO-spondin-like [Discoglossus pictus]